MRLDEYLVKVLKIESRNIAKQLIVEGNVLVDNIVCTKPSTLIKNNIVEITEQLKYVSRAGLKLEHAIKTWSLDFNNKVVLDVGASTGGFSDCSIQNGASKVYALDVGSNQLHKKLLNNKLVTNIPNTNIKDISNVTFEQEIDIIVSDLSFISSKYLFCNLKNIKLADKVIIVSLIKPQFELSPEIVAKHDGKIVDKKYHDQSIENVKQYALQNNCKIIDIIESPITGAKKENKEFLILCNYEK